MVHLMHCVRLFILLGMVLLCIAVYSHVQALVPLPQIDSQAVLVGDIIKLEEDNEVPCDAVVLSTSDANGLCYIQVSCFLCKWEKGCGTAPASSFHPSSPGLPMSTYLCACVFRLCSPTY